MYVIICFVHTYVLIRKSFSYKLLIQEENHDKGFPFIGWMYLKYSLMYAIFIRIAVSLMKSTEKFI